NDQADVHGCHFTRRRHQHQQHHHAVVGLFLSLVLLGVHAHSEQRRVALQHHLLAHERSERLQCERHGAQELSRRSHAAARRIHAHA
ncbi:hypothetical protein M9458_043166, partial [Cirrhinus mrigala]